MSRGFIKVNAKGNIGQLESKTLPSGDQVVNLTLAATESYTDKSGQKVENTTWIRAVAYRKTAELLTNLAQKGSELFVEGKLSVNKWQDQQGQNRETTEIVIDSFELLARGKERQNQHQGQGYQQQNNYQQAPPHVNGQQLPQQNQQYQRPQAVQNNGHHQGQPAQTGHGFNVPTFNS